MRSGLGPLVEKVREWPGIHVARTILDGELRGYWFNRTKEGIARRMGETPGELEFAEEEEVVLSPLPCWEGWSDERIRARVAELVEDIEKDAAAELRNRGVRPLGRAAILKQVPHERPKTTKRSPAPAFHAATKAARLAMREAYGWFLAAYRDAAEKLRKGEQGWKFPEGAFPPALPFARGDLAQAWRQAA